MPDDVVEQPAEQPTEPVAPPDPHPLSPEGARFKEVYAEKKEYERLYIEAQAEVARLQAVKQSQQQQAPQTQFYSEEQLQAMVDRGAITPAKMAAQIAWQEGQKSEQRIKQEWERERKLSGAQQEINEYTMHVPALKDTSSPEFKRALVAAREIAAELDLPIDDPRVTRRALREAVGSLDRIRQGQRTREFARQNADTHTETQRGGGGGSTIPESLRNVPQFYLDHWKQKGYSQEQMEKEAKYVVNRRRYQMMG